MKSRIPNTHAPKSNTPMPFKLTVSLLVSNQIGTVRKCLESLRPLLDRVNSELIVVDTVGEEKSDGSLAVAREYTDKIVHFDWCDDFSAARNTGLDLAQGEWFLTLDDDEWFDDAGPLADFFSSGEEKKYNALHYYVRNYTDTSGTTYNQGLARRGIRLNGKTRFVGTVHEGLEPAFLPVKRMDVFVHHYGYAGNTILEKVKRNRPLMLLELEKDPDNMHIYAQLVQEYFCEADYGQAEETAQRGLARLAQKEERPGKNIDELVVQYLKLLWSQDQWGKTTEVAASLLKEWRLQEMAEACVRVLMADAFYHLENWSETLKQSELYALWQVGCDKEIQQSSIFIQEFYEKPLRPRFFSNAFNAAQNLEKWDEALRYAAMLDWEDENLQSKAANGLLRVVCMSGRTEEFLKICKKIQKNGRLPEAFYVAVRAVKATYPERQRQFAALLAGLPLEDPFYRMQRAMAAVSEGGEELNNALRDCADQGLTFAHPCESLLPLVLQTGTDPGPFLAGLTAEDWCGVAGAVTGACAVKELRELLDAAAALKPYGELFYALFEREALGRLTELASEEELVPSLRAYAEGTVRCGKLLYAPRLFEQAERRFLPCDTRYALELSESFGALDAGDFEACLRGVRRAVQARPDRSELMQRLLDRLDREGEEARSAAKELETLAVQVKERVRALLSAGNRQEAALLLKQLSQILPGDPELPALMAAASLSLG